MRPAIFAIAAFAAAGAAEARVIVTHAEIRPAPAGAPVTAAYMTIRNEGAKSVVLTGAHCICAPEISAHESSMEQGVMRMRPAPRVTIPSHGEVVFKPGGLHLMVMGLKRAIKSAQRVTLSLSFDGAPDQSVVFTAKR